MTKLRPYQKEAEAGAFACWKQGHRKILLVLPTGTGKTIVFCHITAEIVKSGGRVLILAHRDELLGQAADKLTSVTGLSCAFEKAGSSGLGTFFPVTVASVQSLSQEKRLTAYSEDYFHTLIIDEAHHCLSSTYQRVLAHFSDANILGVTATPDRGDQKSLGEFFDETEYRD